MSYASKKNTFENNPKKTIVIFIGISLLLFDFLFKGLLNLYNAVFYSDSIQDVVTSHDVYHHTFKPYKEVNLHSDNGNYTILTNSLGFKDDKKINIEKDIDKKRIIFIGDSFTEGVLLNFEKTFAGIFKKYLAERDIDFLNAGRGGYSPIIYWTKIKHLLEIEKVKFDELYVFIDLSDTFDEYATYDLNENQNVILKNIPQSKPIQRENFIGKTKIFLKENTIFTYFILNYISDTLSNNDYARIWYHHIVNDVHFDKWPINKSAYNEWGEKGIKLQIKYMNKLKKLLDENNVKLTVVVYPWISQIWYEDLNSLHVKIWKDWAKKNNSNFIDLFPLFVKKGISNSEKDKIINENYIRGDFHFNEKGNQIIAEELIRKLDN